MFLTKNEAVSKCTDHIKQENRKIRLLKISNLKEFKKINVEICLATNFDDSIALCYKQTSPLVVSTYDFGYPKARASFAFAQFVHSVLFFLNLKGAVAKCHSPFHFICLSVLLLIFSHKTLQNPELSTIYCNP